MAIKWIKHGDIFESSCPILCNPVNCVGTMGAGLAKQFRDKYGDTIYRTYCKHGLLKPGKTMVVATDDDEKSILLFPTKDHWKDPSKIEYIESGLQDVAINIQRGVIDGSIAFPKIGCGLGGLDWEEDVKPLFLKYLGNAPIDIEVYE